MTTNSTDQQLQGKTLEMPDRIWINPTSLMDDLHREHARIFPERYFKNDIEYVRAVIAEPRGDAQQRRLEIALGYIKRAANRELPKLPCRVDEMTEREVAVFNVGAAAVGNLQFIARELDALPDAAASSPTPAESEFGDSFVAAVNAIKAISEDRRAAALAMLNNYFSTANDAKVL